MKMLLNIMMLIQLSVLLLVCVHIKAFDILYICETNM